MATEELTQAFLVGRDQYLVDTLAYRAILDPNPNWTRLTFQSVPAGSQVWADWLTVDAAGVVTIPSLLFTGSVPWTAITGTPTTLAGYGVTSPLDAAEGGTGTGVTFTEGSVVFAGPLGVYTEDNANLFWDDASHSLGIGTSSPLSLVHASMADDGNAILTIEALVSTRYAATQAQNDIVRKATLIVFGSTAAGNYDGIPLANLAAFEGSADNTAIIYDFGTLNIINPATLVVGQFATNGNFSLGMANPTARLHLAAGTATAETAPLKFTSGVVLATPEIGAMEFIDNGVTGHLYITLNVAGVLTRVQII